MPRLFTSINLSSFNFIDLSPKGLAVDGTSGNDRLYGTDYADTIHGGFGNDTEYGGAGNDTLYGDAGNDYLVGGEGNDVVDGGSGDDYVMAGNGMDTFIGGDGSDTLSFADSNLQYGITVDLTTETTSTDDTFTGFENIVGGIHGDILNGDANNNTLDGNSGDDWLFGQAGNDTLIGGEGFDVLRGGDGADILIGGAGNDILTGDGDNTVGFDIFVISPDSGTDRITDFQTGIDKIRLDGFGPDPFGDDGKLAWAEFKDNDFHHEWVTSNFDGDSLIRMSDGLYAVEGATFINGNLASLDLELLVQFDNNAAYTSSDFLFNDAGSQASTALTSEVAPQVTTDLMLA